MNSRECIVCNNVIELTVGDSDVLINNLAVSCTGEYDVRAFKYDAIEGDTLILNGTTVRRHNCHILKHCIVTLEGYVLKSGRKLNCTFLNSTEDNNGLALLNSLDCCCKGFVVSLADLSNYLKGRVNTIFVYCDVAIISRDYKVCSLTSKLTACAELNCGLNDVIDGCCCTIYKLKCTNVVTVECMACAGAIDCKCRSVNSNSAIVAAVLAGLNLCINIKYRAVNELERTVVTHRAAYGNSRVIDKHVTRCVREVEVLVAIYNGVHDIDIEYGSLAVGRSCEAEVVCEINNTVSKVDIKVVGCAAVLTAGETKLYVSVSYVKSSAATCNREAAGNDKRRLNSCLISSLCVLNRTGDVEYIAITESYTACAGDLKACAGTDVNNMVIVSCAEGSYLNVVADSKALTCYDSTINCITITKKSNACGKSNFADSYVIKKLDSIACLCSSSCFFKAIIAGVANLYCVKTNQLSKSFICIIALNLYLITQYESRNIGSSTAKVVAGSIYFNGAGVFLNDRSAGFGVSKYVTIDRNRIELITLCLNCAVHIIKSNYLVSSAVNLVTCDNESHILNKSPAGELEEYALIVCFISVNGKSTTANEAGKIGSVICAALIEDRRLVVTKRCVKYVVYNLAITLERVNNDIVAILLGKCTGINYNVLTDETKSVVTANEVNVGNSNVRVLVCRSIPRALINTNMERIVLSALLDSHISEGHVRGLNYECAGRRIEGKDCTVTVNSDTLVDYDRLSILFECKLGCKDLNSLAILCSCKSFLKRIVLNVADLSYGSSRNEEVVTIAVNEATCFVERRSYTGVTALSINGRTVLKSYGSVTGCLHRMIGNFYIKNRVIKNEVRRTGSVSIISLPECTYINLSILSRNHTLVEVDNRSVKFTAVYVDTCIAIAVGITENEGLGCNSHATLNIEFSSSISLIVDSHGNITLNNSAACIVEEAAIRNIESDALSKNKCIGKIYPISICESNSGCDAICRNDVTAKVCANKVFLDVTKNCYSVVVAGYSLKSLCKSLILHTVNLCNVVGNLNSYTVSGVAILVKDYAFNELNCLNGIVKKSNSAAGGSNLCCLSYGCIDLAIYKNTACTIIIYTCGRNVGCNECTVRNTVKVELKHTCAGIGVVRKSYARTGSKNDSGLVVYRREISILNSKVCNLFITFSVHFDTAEVSECTTINKNFLSAICPQTVSVVRTLEGTALEGNLAGRSISTICKCTIGVCYLNNIKDTECKVHKSCVGNIAACNLAKNKVLESNLLAGSSDITLNIKVYFSIFSRTNEGDGAVIAGKSRCHSNLIKDIYNNIACHSRCSRKSLCKSLITYAVDFCNVCRNRNEILISSAGYVSNNGFGDIDFCAGSQNNRSTAHTTGICTCAYSYIIYIIKGKVRNGTTGNRTAVTASLILTNDTTDRHSLKVVVSIINSCVSFNDYVFNNAIGDLGMHAGNTNNTTNLTCTANSNVLNGTIGDVIILTVVTYDTTNVVALVRATVVDTYDLVCGRITTDNRTVADLTIAVAIDTTNHVVTGNVNRTIYVTVIDAAGITHTNNCTNIAYTVKRNVLNLNVVDRAIGKLTEETYVTATIYSEVRNYIILTIEVALEGVSASSDSNPCLGAKVDVRGKYNVLTLIGVSTIYVITELNKSLKVRDNEGICLSTGTGNLRNRSFYNNLAVLVKLIAVCDNISSNILHCTANNLALIIENNVYTCITGEGLKIRMKLNIACGSSITVYSVIRLNVNATIASGRAANLNPNVVCTTYEGVAVEVCGIRICTSSVLTENNTVVVRIYSVASEVKNRAICDSHELNRVTVCLVCGRRTEGVTDKVSLGNCRPTKNGVCTACSNDVTVLYGKSKILLLRSTKRDERASGVGICSIRRLNVSVYAGNGKSGSRAGVNPGVTLKVKTAYSKSVCAICVDTNICKCNRSSCYVSTGDNKILVNNNCLIRNVSDNNYCITCICCINSCLDRCEEVIAYLCCLINAIKSAIICSLINICAGTKNVIKAVYKHIVAVKLCLSRLVSNSKLFSVNNGSPRAGSSTPKNNITCIRRSLYATCIKSGGSKKISFCIINLNNYGVFCVDVFHVDSKCFTIGIVVYITTIADLAGRNLCYIVRILCATFATNTFVEAMTLSRNYSLCNENFVTYGAVLTLGKTGFFALRCYCRVNCLGMSKLIDSLSLGAKFFLTNRAVNYKVVRALCLTGSGNDVFLNCLSRSVICKGKCFSRNNLATSTSYSYRTSNLTSRLYGCCRCVNVTGCGNCSLTLDVIATRAILVCGVTGILTICILTCYVNKIVTKLCCKLITTYCTCLCSSTSSLSTCGVICKRKCFGRNNLATSTSYSYRTSNLTSRLYGCCRCVNVTGCGNCSLTLDVIATRAILVCGVTGILTICILTCYVNKIVTKLCCKLITTYCTCLCSSTSSLSTCGVICKRKCFGRNNLATSTSYSYRTSNLTSRLYGCCRCVNVTGCGNCSLTLDVIATRAIFICGVTGILTICCLTCYVNKIVTKLCFKLSTT